MYNSFFFYHFRTMAELQPSASGMISISNIEHLNASNICYYVALVHVELGILESTARTSPILTLSSSPTSVEVTLQGPSARI